jgi:hypothetical protein
VLSKMVRKVVFAVTLVAACSIVVSAQAVGPAQLSLSPSAYKVLYGHKLTLSGKLVGGKPGELVSIRAWPYGHSAPIRIVRVRTNGSGQFSLKVKPTIQTAYQAQSSNGATKTVTVGVMPFVSITELANGRVRTHVNAGRSMNRKFVKLQTLTPSGWSTVDQKRLSTAGVAVFSTTLPSSPVRIVMSVNQAGAGFLATASHALGYKAYDLTIAAPNRVLYGHRLMLSGRLLNGRAGQQISIVARPYGQSAPRKIATVKTTAGGRWSLSVKPRIQTAYQARWASAQSSARINVGVQPLVTVTELGDGSVMAHVTAGRPFIGRMVKLQQLTTAGSWTTLAQRPLNAKSKVLFPIALGDSSIRVAMSVNQAGVGLLGTASHPLAYHAV